MHRPPPRHTLFPYTTLFRSRTRLWRPFPLDVAECAHLGDGGRASRHGAGHRETRGTGSAQTILGRRRSEEHTSELQSRQYLVCRLLLEKKNITRASAELGMS